MKMPRFLSGLVLMTVSCIGTTVLTGQDNAAPPDATAMMKLWKQFSTPGEQHEKLNALVGKWTTKTKLFMAGPDGPAQESDGQAVFRWVLGKRFLQQEHSGSMLNEKTEGIGMLGYDNFKKKFTSVWFESVGTATLTSEGLLNRDGSKITFYGEMDEFLTGEHDKMVRYELTLPKNDVMTFKIYDLHIGTNGLVVEIVYNRVK